LTFRELFRRFPTFLVLTRPSAIFFFARFSRFILRASSTFSESFLNLFQPFPLSSMFFDLPFRPIRAIHVIQLGGSFTMLRQ
jgi:hypothetical protein